MALERFDGFAPLRNGLSRIANDRREFAGIPMPIDGARLIVEPTYPKAKELSEIGAKPEDAPEPNITLRNSWRSRRLGARVFVYEENGRARAAIAPAAHSLDKALSTLACSVAWGIEQERRAIDLLGSMLRHHVFKQYLLTGMFVEKSERSGVLYLFRRLRPTVAISLSGDRPHVLAALCMHPIAYYADSWAGAMTPTDDVVAHLAMMRGDEVMLWRRSNQHAPTEPEAGL